ncbi:MAG TPA: hypothetical protein VES65_02415 [Solirubrobacteraceae bacterium]|nr:hypothetical protein [Solirubrobacteraceae bacterium]
MMTGKRTTRAGLTLAAAFAAACTATLAAGCAATRHPGPIGARELAEAQTFPYYRIYWVGPRFAGQPLAAADGRSGYNSSVGDSVYYGDCIAGKGVFGGGGACTLPLQVTTVIYRLHDNAALGPQRNLLIRGVPATSYDEGRSIELYSGRVAIDVFSDTFAHAREAALLLRPLNARGSATAPLPPPVYCPGLSDPQDRQLQHAMASLPGHACQRAATEIAFARSLRVSAAAPPPRDTDRADGRDEDETAG